ncbi:MAG: hypothetical protein PHQ43_00235 [Dehalococcoidales bacterium]|nr:hypothetical protein [Dehalococcoidales bacterium]
MVATKQIQGKVVAKYLERYPDMPSLTLARFIAQSEDGHLFANQDAIRTTIRYYRGRQGNRSREFLSDRRFLQEPSPENPFSLPEAYSLEYKPFFIPTDLHRGLIIADLHIPYHDQQALTCILDYAKKYQPQWILVDEVLDFYQMSWFRRDPSKPQIKDELTAGRQFFAVMRLEFPKTAIYYHLSNHEERFKHYLWDHKELYDTKSGQPIPELRLENILDLFNIGVEMYGDKRVTWIGKLSYIHGHEFGGGVSVPVNPARTLFLKSHSSAACAHFHQTSEHTESNIKGEMMTCWSIGCACQLHPEYRPLNKWNHGFATVETQADGMFTLRNYRIIDGQII